MEPNAEPTSPVISIITPVYNGERTVERALRSLLGQSFRAWEAIVRVHSGERVDGTSDVLNYAL